MTLGISALAVPLRDERGTVRAGLTLSGPTEEFDPDVLVGSVKMTAAIMVRVGARIIRRL